MKTRRRFVLAAFVALQLFTSLVSARTHALLVGINDYAGRFALTSPRRDVAAMRDLLITRFGWREDSIDTLLDAAVTHAGLEQTFQRDLIDSVGPEDTVVFFFSGHGSFVHDEDGDEEDGLDEVLVLADASASPPVARASLLIDDELGRWIARIPAKRVFIILDACHAGTGTRAAPRNGGQSKYFDLGFRPNATRSAATATKSPAAQVGIARGETKRPVIVLAASRADQVSWATADGESLFTSGLVKLLKENSSATGAQFLKTVIPFVEQRALIDYGSVQTPQLEGAWSETFEAAATNAAASAPPPTAPIPAAVPVAVSPLDLRLEINQPRFKIGEKVVVNVRVAKDAYVQLYHTSADGEVQLIFPNRFDANNLVRAGASVSFPAASAPFQFTVSPPSGTERITAYASESPLPAPPGLQRGGAGPFLAHDELTPASAHLRGLRVEAKGTATASVITAIVEYYVEE